MKKRILSLLLCAIMTLSPLPKGALATEVAAVEAKWGTSADTLSSSGTLVDAVTAANAASGTTYIQLQKDVNTTNYLSFSSGKTVLDLNGKIIDRGLTSSQAYGYVVKVAGNLTINDSSTPSTGKITGGNNSANTGGGVYVASGGSFTLTGGSISGNTSDGGGGVSVYNGSFTMSGGSITGNTSSGDGGVSVRNGSTFHVSAAANISGNFKGSTASNVYLSDNTTITVTGALTGTIGVSTLTAPTQAKPVNVAVGKTGDSAYTITSTDAANFTSDDASYRTSLSGDKVVLSNVATITPEAEWTPTNGSLTTGTFADGLKAMEKSGGSIKLLQNVSTTDKIWLPGKEITLDLNGKTLTSVNGIQVTGKLTLKDTGAGGGGKITSTNSSTVYVVTDGTFNMQSGSITATGTSCYGINNNGTLKLSGGTVKSEKIYAINNDGGTLYLSGAPTITTTGAIKNIVCTPRAKIFANDGDASTPSYSTGNISIQIPSGSNWKSGDVVVSGLQDETHAKKFTFASVPSALATVYVDADKSIKLAAQPESAVAPAITNDLSTTQVVYNQNATATALNATATVTDGGTISYAWYSNTTDSNSGGTSLNVTAATYTPPTTAEGTTYYYCVVTNTNSAATTNKTATTTSAVANIKVTAAATEKITITVSDGTTTSANVDGTSLSDAITKSGLAESAITRLTITAGEVTVADWTWFGRANAPALSALTEFAIDSAVTKVADLPACVDYARFPTTIEKVSIPQEVKIGNSTFIRCNALTDVNLPKVKILGSGAFGFCSALVTISLPAVTNIGDFAFNYCRSLATLKLGATPPTIAYATAFANCPVTRSLKLVDADGTTELTGTALTDAQTAYDAVTTGSGTATDDLWFGWKVREPAVCTCTLDNATVPSGSYGVGGATNTTFATQNAATAKFPFVFRFDAQGAQIGGSCAVAGHSTNKIAYNYTLISQSHANNVTITNGNSNTSAAISFAAAGNATINCTASANGKTRQFTATLTVNQKAISPAPGGELNSPLDQTKVDAVFGTGNATLNNTTTPPTITINNNITVESPIIIKTFPVTIDLDGNTMKGKGGTTPVIKIDNSGAATITGGGSINGGNGGVGVEVGAGSTVTISGGTFVNGGDSSTGNGGDAISGGGSVNLDRGTANGGNSTVGNGGDGIDVAGSITIGTGGNAIGGNGGNSLVTGGAGGNGTNGSTTTINGSTTGGNGGNGSGNGNGGSGGNGANQGSGTVGGSGSATGGNGGTGAGTGAGGSGGAGVGGGATAEGGLTVKNGISKKVEVIGDATADVTLPNHEQTVDAVMTASEKADAAITDVKVTLKVDDKTTDKPDEALVEGAKPADSTVAAFFDITLQKTVTRPDGATTTTVTATENSQKIAITMEIPVDMRGGSNYAVICVHGGIGKKLATTQIGNSLTFSTDKFSTYAIAYTPKSVNPPPAGGDFTPPTYTPETPTVDHGSVTVSPKNPAKGDKVTVIVTPDPGYEAGQITVTDKDGKNVPVTRNADGSFSFIQPQGAVKIAATMRLAWNPFGDVKVGDWFHDSVQYVYENGLMAGMYAQTFAPNSGTSRAMIVTILWRMQGEPKAKAASNFVDVPAGAWYSEAIAWAQEQNLAAGVDATHFEPNRDISRQELASLFYRYAVLAKLAPTGAWQVPLTYADKSKIADWAVEGAMFAQLKGFIKGRPGNIFAPNAPATRAEASSMLQRFITAK